MGTRGDDVIDRPMQDTALADVSGNADEQLRQAECWGSAHAQAWNVALCDGSVRGISYLIAPDIHQRLANRQDGGIIPADSF